MKTRIKIQGALIFTALILILLLSRFVFPRWQNKPLDEFLDVLGLVLVLTGFLFRISARGYKEEESAQGKKLVREGPYYLMRHPMYFGSFLIGTGIITVLLESWIFPLFLIVYFLIYIPQVRKEEGMLLERFGQEYKDYCKTTPRIFPRPGNLIHLKKYIALKPAWIKKELSSLIWVVVGLLAMETWQDIVSFGYAGYLKEISELLAAIGLSVIVIKWFLVREGHN